MTQASFETQQILDGLEPLFKEAEEKGLWFWCHYQDLWFSPKQLRERHSQGKFIWGAVNWKLRDPKQYVENARQDVATAEAELKRREAEVAGSE